MGAEVATWVECVVVGVSEVLYGFCLVDKGAITDGAVVGGCDLVGHMKERLGAEAMNDSGVELVFPREMAVEGVAIGEAFGAEGAAVDAGFMGERVELEVEAASEDDWTMRARIASADGHGPWADIRCEGTLGEKVTDWNGAKRALFIRASELVR